MRTTIQYQLSSFSTSGQVGSTWTWAALSFHTIPCCHQGCFCTDEKATRRNDITALVYIYRWVVLEDLEGLELAVGLGRHRRRHEHVMTCCKVALLPPNATAVLEGLADRADWQRLRLRDQHREDIRVVRRCAHLHISFLDLAWARVDLPPKLLHGDPAADERTLFGAGHRPDRHAGDGVRARERLEAYLHVALAQVPWRHDLPPVHGAAAFGA